MSNLLGKNKYIRYLILSKCEKLIPNLPETEIFSEKGLWKMLDKYNEVILKPTIGQRGKGIMKVSVKNNETFEVHSEMEINTIIGRKETYQYLVNKIGDNQYMIQYRVQLSVINGCPIDLRVMVQRKKAEDPWTVTGKVVKVAGKGYIVTNNARSKGTILSVTQAMNILSIDKKLKRNILKKINRVTILAAENLAEYMPGHRAYGFDIGLDKNNRIWIIEANRSPMVSHFQKLDNKTQYKRIIEYKSGE